MVIYKNACELSKRKVKIVTNGGGSVKLVSMDTISTSLKAAAAVYGLDECLINERHMRPRGLLLPHIPSRFIYNKSSVHRWEKSKPIHNTVLFIHTRK